MKRRFLIIDDVKSVREVLKAILKRSFSADIFEAETNAQAFAYLKKFSIDLITTDLIRPHKSGFDFLNRIQSDMALRTIPVIVISAVADDKKALDLYRAGARGVFQKPFDDYKQLIAHVNFLLNTNTDLNPDRVLINLGTEKPFLDYKKKLDLSTAKGCASITKDIIAMANYGGGIIIVGVDEVKPGKFVSRGLKKDQLAGLGTSNFSKKLSKYMSPVVSVKVRGVRENGKDFIIVEVPSANEQPIMAAKQCKEAGLYRGRIYSRTATAKSAEIQDSEEIRRLIDRFVFRQLRDLKKSWKTK